MRIQYTRPHARGRGQIAYLRPRSRAKPERMRPRSRPTLRCRGQNRGRGQRR